MRMRKHVAFDTALPPDEVIAALTDFGPDRIDIWPSLDPNEYKVFEVGEKCAVVREGTRRPNVWARERYDWSTPGTVSWTPEASNAFRPGTKIELVVRPNAGGGSHVEMDAERIAASPIGYFVVGLLALLGKRFLLSTYKANFDRIAAEKSASL